MILIEDDPIIRRMERDGYPHAERGGTGLFIHTARAARKKAEGETAWQNTAETAGQTRT